jgi:hypothetical protein
MNRTNSEINNITLLNDIKRDMQTYQTMLKNGNPAAKDMNDGITFTTLFLYRNGWITREQTETLLGVNII